ncbi:toll-like receptor 4 isoform X1 [Ostrea edulis]|uniref:toll-like receptor 4 isoform X1 n=1 Tax=Ostrea edulis TaxID=37623 RepID=UPI0024AEEA51|nr:toll-like receptor 4 isoform X1 [Ostrea edulis]
MKMSSTKAVHFIMLNIFTWILHICIHGGVFACKLTPFRSNANHNGFLWNCSHENLDYIPDIPAQHRRHVVAVDLSHNNFKMIREETFTNLTADIQFLFLNKNGIVSLEANTFRRISAMLLLDVSSCLLETKSIQLGAFNNLTRLETLYINDNSFESYPAVEISKLESLVNLTIDIFPGFHFDDNFLNLKTLGRIHFDPQGLITLTNISFQGLRNSPIHYLDMNFYNQIDNFCKGLPDDVFCSFPFLKGLTVSFGMSCGIKHVLRTLKCLQDKQLDYFHSSDNHELNNNNYVIINEFDVEYLRNICIKELILRNNDILGVEFQLPLGKFQSCLEVVDLSSNQIQFASNQRVWLGLILFTPNIQVIKICCQNARSSVSKAWGRSYSDEYKRRRETNFKRYTPFKVILPKTLNYFDISIANRFSTNLPNIYIHAKNLLFLNISGTTFDISKPYYISSYVYLDFPLLTEMDASHTKTNVDTLSLQNSVSLKSLAATDSDFIRSTDGVRKRILHGLKSLKYVDLSDNSISNLPLDFFASQKDLNMTINLDKNNVGTDTSVPKALSIVDNIHQLYLRHCYDTYMDHKIAYDSLLTLRVSTLYLGTDMLGCYCNSKHGLMTLWKIRRKIADLDEMNCEFLSAKHWNLKVLFTVQNWRSYRLNCIVQEFLFVFSISLLTVTLSCLICAMTIYKFSIISRCTAFDYRGKFQAMHRRVCEFYNERRRRKGHKYDPLDAEEIDTTRQRNDGTAMAIASTESNDQTRDTNDTFHLEEQTRDINDTLHSEETDSDKVSHEPESVQT